MRPPLSTRLLAAMVVAVPVTVIAFAVAVSRGSSYELAGFIAGGVGCIAGLVVQPHVGERDVD